MDVGKIDKLLWHYISDIYCRKHLSSYIDELSYEKVSYVIYSPLWGACSCGASIKIRTFRTEQEIWECSKCRKRS